MTLTTAEFNVDVVPDECNFLDCAVPDTGRTNSLAKESIFGLPPQA